MNIKMVPLNKRFKCDCTKASFMKIEKRLLSLIGVFLFISHLLMLPAFSADPLDAPYPNNPGGRLDFLKKGIDPASSDVIAAWRRVRNELGVYSPGGIIEDVRGLQNRTAVAERDLAALRATNPAAIAAQAARVPGLEARVLTLEADVVTLTGERNTLRVDLITRTRERDAFAADLRIRTTERDRLNLDIAAERATIVILQRDLADRIKERDDFEARLLASLTTLGLRDAEIVAHEAELEVRKNKIIGLEHDKLAVEAELSLKEAELVIITSERDQLKLDIATERATIITLRQDLATRTGERNQLNINIGTLQHDLVDTESKRADCEVKWVASQSA